MFRDIAGVTDVASDVTRRDGVRAWFCPVTGPGSVIVENKSAVFITKGLQIFFPVILYIMVKTLPARFTHAAQAELLNAVESAGEGAALRIAGELRMLPPL